MCNDNESEASPLALIWGTGLLGVVTSLAKRKSDEFDSHVLHHTLLYANWQSGLIQNQLFVSSTLTRSTNGLNSGETTTRRISGSRVSARADSD